MRQPVSHILSLCVLCAWLCTFMACSGSGSTHEHVHHMLSAGLALEDSDVVTAYDLYEEAFDELRQHPDSSLLHEVSVRKGLLLMRYGLAEESISELYRAFVIDSLRHDSVKMIRMARYMAFAYESMGHWERARGAISRVIHFPLTRLGEQDHQLTFDYYDRYHRLQELLDRLPKDYVKEIPRMRPNSTEMELVVQGWLQEEKGDMPMAVAWYSKILDKPSSYAQAFALMRLARYQLREGNVRQAVNYLDVYHQVQGRIRLQETTTKQLLQHYASYQDRRAQSKIYHLSLANQRQVWLLVTVLVTSTLAVASLLLLIRTYRQRQIILRFKVDKLRQMRTEWLARSEQERRQLTEVQTDAAQRLRRNLNSTDIRVLTDADWADLEDAVSAVCPDFRTRLSDLCRMSAHDYHVCLLLKMGIKPSDIARLTARSDEAITSTRRRLYARAFGRKGTPAEWDEVIRML